jgi:Domain of unknown function (DUF1707)
MSSSQRPYSHLRASDAERERVVAFLRDHALQGRLTHDELEERIGLAYSSVTMGDLERLIADLPRPHAPAPRRPRPARPRHSQHRQHPSPALIVAGMAIVLFTGLPVLVMGGVLVALALVFALSFVLGPFLLVGLIVALSTRRHHRRPHGPPMRWGRVY